MSLCGPVGSGVMAISDWLSVRVDGALLQTPVAGYPTRLQSEIGLQEGYTGNADEVSHTGGRMLWLRKGTFWLAGESSASFHEVSDVTVRKRAVDMTLLCVVGGPMVALDARDFIRSDRPNEYGRS